jgi:hypothetical protein
MAEINLPDTKLQQPSVKCGAFCIVQKRVNRGSTEKVNKTKKMKKTVKKTVNVSNRHLHLIHRQTRNTWTKFL